jgi:hypothetical protein
VIKTADGFGEYIFFSLICKVKGKRLGLPCDRSGPKKYVKSIFEGKDTEDIINFVQCEIGVKGYSLIRLSRRVILVCTAVSASFVQRSGLSILLVKIFAVSIHFPGFSQLS